jgi:hypothetical protein
MIYDLDGIPRFDLEHDLNRFVPKQDNLAVVRAILFGSIFGALVWAVIVFLLWKVLSWTP